MIRNILFKIFFFSGIGIICILFLPALILPQTITLIGGKIMGYWAKYCLRIFLSVKTNIVGKENLLINEKFFIACSHQSMFETFFLQTIFNSPIFILKKELLKIPVFGLYLKKIGSISIDRNKTTKENFGFFDNILSSVNNSNRPLLIFPQGTRVLPSEKAKFKKGTARIYETLNVKFDHELDISFNSRYLLDVASQLDGDKIEMFLNETGSPALIKDPSDFDSIFVVMPMKG